MKIQLDNHTVKLGVHIEFESEEEAREFAETFNFIDDYRYSPQSFYFQLLVLRSKIYELLR